MKFNLKLKSQRSASFAYFMKLANSAEFIEVKEISPRRTLPQNSYLHLIIGDFGQHFGYTLEEAKQIYKEMNADTYRYQKKGRVFWRSSADITKEEMAKTIDRFRQKAADAGYELPLATNQEWIMQVQNEIERSKHYL